MRFLKSIPDETMYPYILVNIGSGVSILKITGHGKYERISGTSLGGGTLWGLSNMLTGVNSFDEILEMSEKGDNHHVDMVISSTSVLLCVVH